MREGSKKRIAVLDAGHPTYCVGASYTRAFNALGNSARLINPLQEFPTASLVHRAIARFDPKYWVRRVLPPLLNKLQPHQWDLIYVGKGEWLDRDSIHQIRTAHPATPLICFNGDNPLRAYSRGSSRPWLGECIPLYDYFASYTPTICEQVQKAGARNVIHLPFAWDSLVQPDGVVAQYPLKQDIGNYVTFVANGDRWRANSIRSIANKLGQHSDGLAVYGYWKKRDKQVLGSMYKGPQLTGGQLTHAIQNSAASLNILREQNISTHNMRTFEVPGMGGLMVSNYTEEQDAFFPNGSESLLYQDPAEAAEYIRTALDNSSSLTMMRTSAHSTAMSNTYIHRAQSLLDTVFGQP